MRKKVLIVVQCRSNSTRLRGKALYPISGIPIIVFLLRRLRSGLWEDEYRIVLATTKNQQDDVVESLGLEEGVDVVRGEEDDVLKRYMECLERYPTETVVRVTADNPLTCPEITKWLVKEKQDRNSDYVKCENLPYGAGVDVFSSGLLRILNKETKDQDEREHINLFVLRNKEKFNICSQNAKGDIARPDLRMTIDTREDWQLVKSLFRRDEIEPWRITLREVIERMDKTCV
jgi:spore coat polysaccharide biosynthesis protein SpsF